MNKLFIFVAERGDEWGVRSKKKKADAKTSALFVDFMNNLLVRNSEKLIFFLPYRNEGNGYKLKQLYAYHLR